MRCAAGHMGPALQGIFVGQGPRALPGVRCKTGRRGEGTPPYGGVTRRACVIGGRTEASAPTDGLQEVCGAGDREGRPYGRVQEVPAWIAGGVEPRPYGGVAGKCLHGIPQSASLTAPKGTGVTDYHNRCAHRHRNDTLQGVPWAAGHMGPALQAQILYLFMCKTNQNTL